MAAIGRAKVCGVALLPCVGLASALGLAHCGAFDSSVAGAPDASAEGAADAPQVDGAVAADASADGGDASGPPCVIFDGGAHGVVDTTYQNGLHFTGAQSFAVRGGTIDVNGRISTPATETMGALSVLLGANTITGSTGGGTITSAQLTFQSLTRTPGATINFTGTNLGSEGNNAKILFTTPLTTVAGGALGAWAIANTSDYAAYNQSNGVGVVGLNWDVQILGCKFLSASGSGSTANAIKCFNYITELKEKQGYNIVLTSNSWGGGQATEALREAMSGPTSLLRA